MNDLDVRSLLAAALAEVEPQATPSDPLRRLRQAQARATRRRGYAFSLAFIGLVTAVQLLPHPALAATRCAAPATCLASAAVTAGAPSWPNVASQPS
jgi:hypothetical protein